MEPPPPLDQVGNTSLQLPSLDGVSAIFCSGEEALRATILNAAAGVTVTLTGRFLPADGGRVNVLNQPLIPTTNRVASTIAVPLGVGWLLDASLIVTAGTPLVGQTYGIISLQRGLATSNLEVTTLAEGYITAKQRLFVPGVLSRGFLEDGGALRSITGSTPAAGAEISETVPTGARWELLVFSARLVTAVAVANRQAALFLDDGVNVYAKIGNATAQAASLTWDYGWYPGGPFGNASPQNIVQSILPTRVILGSGHRIRTSTTNMQAADQYSAVQYLVLERIEA